MSFLSELKRRNVIRVALAYLVASWLLLQVTDVLIGMLALPDWIGKFIFLIIVIGIVPTLIFSWAYEMTPEGLRPEAEVDHDQSITLHTAKKLDRITIILLLVVASIIVIDRLIPESAAPSDAVTVESPNNIPTATESPATPAPVQQPITVPDDGRQSIAVLPFINMSDDQQNEYFSDGISEELLNSLVRIKSLRVPSRTSSFVFKNSDKNLLEIGRALNVQHILEGSVRKAGKQIRVTAQLIEVATDTHLWSETFTRSFDLDDIFVVQDEISQLIVDALQLTLSGADLQMLSSHSTNDVDAYNKYLLGRHLWNQRTAKSLLAAAEPLLEAVEMDPGYDQAWAALADTYVLIPEYRGGSIQEYLPKAREALNKALEINPNSSRALTTSGYYKAAFDFDWEGSNADFERAIELDPGYATARQWYGESLVWQRRLEQGLDQLRVARVADPLSRVVRHVPGYFLLWNFRFDESEKHLKDALELGQPLRWTIQNLEMLHTFRGEYEQARQRARQLAAMEDFDPALELSFIDAMENPDLKPHALKLLEQRQDMNDGVFGRALYLALLGEHELALANLEKAFAAGDPYAVQMNYMKMYDPLREKPRFQAMLRAMNLSE